MLGYVWVILVSLLCLYSVVLHASQQHMCYVCCTCSLVSWHHNGRLGALRCVVMCGVLTGSVVVCRCWCACCTYMLVRGLLTCSWVANSTLYVLRQCGCKLCAARWQLVWPVAVWLYRWWWVGAIRFGQRKYTFLSQGVVGALLGYAVCVHVGV